MRTRPTGSALTGRGSSVHTDPGLRTAGGWHAECLGELGHEAEAGGVVLDGHFALAGPARGARWGGAGGHRAVVRFHALEVVAHAPDRFMRMFQTSSRLQQLMKHDCRRWTAGWPGVSRAATYETAAVESPRHHAAAVGRRGPAARRAGPNTAHEPGCVVSSRVFAAVRSPCRQVPGGSPWCRRKAAANAKGEP